MKVKYCKASIILISFLLFGIGTASAQFRIGAKGAFDIADKKVNSDILSSKNRLGFTIGATAEYMTPIFGLGVDASLLYGHKKYNVKDKGTDADITDYNYISVPVNLKKRFSIVPNMFGLYIAAGPYANIRISGGDLEIKETAEDVYDKFKAKSFEFGVNAGAGVTVLENLDVGVYYRCRLTNNFSSNDPDLDNLKDKKFQTWSLGATYFF